MLRRRSRESDWFLPEKAADLLMRLTMKLSFIVVTPLRLSPDAEDRLRDFPP